MELKRNKKLIAGKYTEYFIPTVLTAMANNIAILVDGTIVGNLLGSSSFAAVNLLSPVTQLYFSLSILIGLAASSIIARAKGENDKKTADGIFTTAFMTLLILSVLLIVIQFIFLGKIAGVLTNNAELKTLLIKYYIPYIAGTPVTLFLTSCIHCIRTDNRPKFASNLIIISNVVNLVLDIVLIKVFHLGIEGASIATIIGNLVAFLIMLTHFRRKDNTLKLSFSAIKGLGSFFKYFKSLLTTGVSAALGTMLITIRMFFLNTLIQNAGGKGALVAYSVVTMCQILMSAFVTGASQTMIPIVSVLLGERDYSGIKTAFYKAMKILLGSSILLTVVIEIFPSTISKVYGINTVQGMSVAVNALRITSVSLVGLAFTFLFLYYFMCTDKKVFSTVISILNGIALIIPLGLLFAKFYSINGVWWSLVAAQYLTLIITIIIALVLKIKKKDKYSDLFLLDKTQNSERTSFSYEAQNYNESEVFTFISTGSNKELAERTINVLKKLNECKTAKRKKSQTDVRICLEEKYYVIIKNNGAVVENPSEFQNDYPNIVYNQVLGFNQIKISL